ncbi:S-methyl-5-thioribose-1-phosphate isomerase [Blastocladiella emersonii ATCC 22665]|nr:S-methyl-5-thioribose-1-phosphate isomerase [Blastocladiella emersonii ATCC 22665]
MALEAIRYTRGDLRLLNQLLLPHESVWEPVPTIAEAHAQIRAMKVRGAPAIGVTAALAIAVVLATDAGVQALGKADLLQWLDDQCAFLATSRPTAVNLFDAIAKLKAAAVRTAGTIEDVATVREVVIEVAENYFAADLADNHAIGARGRDWLLASVGVGSRVRVLTHCNTGSLATAGHGTALGIVRSLHAAGALDHVYCTETRPYNQGSRLTAYELTYEKMPATLVTDSMAAFLMRRHPVHAVIVGADRIARNGDTANKIGTYQLALVARAHGVKVIVAAPLTTLDMQIPDGDAIPIEERPANELTRVTGALVGEPTVKLATVQVAPVGMDVWNPGFDVTPADLIDAIVTERGVITKAAGATAFDVPGFLASLK